MGGKPQKWLGQSRTDTSDTGANDTWHIGQTLWQMANSANSACCTLMCCKRLWLLQSLARNRIYIYTILHTLIFWRNEICASQATLGKLPSNFPWRSGCISLFWCRSKNHNCVHHQMGQLDHSRKIPRAEANSEQSATQAWSILQVTIKSSGTIHANYFFKNVYGDSIEVFPFSYILQIWLDSSWICPCQNKPSFCMSCRTS